jgi:hypothetical protein
MTSVLTDYDGLGGLTHADLRWRVKARPKVQDALQKLLEAEVVPDRELMLSHFALTGVALSLWRAIPLISARPRSIVEVFQNTESMFRRVLSHGRSDFQADLAVAPWAGGYYLKNALRRLPETDLALGTDVRVPGRIVVHGHDQHFDELDPRDPSVDRPPTKVWDILQSKLDELVERWIRHAERAAGAEPDWPQSAPGRRDAAARDSVADKWKVGARKTIGEALLELDDCALLIRSHPDLMSQHLALAGAGFSLWKAIDLLSSTPRFVDEVFHSAQRVAQRINALGWVRDFDELQGCSWSSGYYLRNAWYRLDEVDTGLGTPAHDLRFRKLEPRNLAVDTPAIEIWPVLCAKLVELTESLKLEVDSRSTRGPTTASQMDPFAIDPAPRAVDPAHRSTRLGLINMVI